MIWDPQSMWWLLIPAALFIGLVILAHVEEGKCEPLPEWRSATDDDKGGKGTRTDAAILANRCQNLGVIQMIDNKGGKGTRTDAAILYRGLERIEEVAESLEAWNDIFTDGGYSAMTRPSLKEIVELAALLRTQIHPDNPTFVVFEIKNARRALGSMRQVAGALETLDNHFAPKETEVDALMQRAIATAQHRTKNAIMTLRQEVRDE